MNLIVTDANILIYLSRLELMDVFMQMDFEIHTTDFIIDEYQKGKKKEQNLKDIEKYIRNGRFTIHEYDLETLLKIYEERKGLSPADCSVFKLSQDLKGILLTSDRTLRLYSEGKGITVYGIIWLLDEMIERKVIDKIEYKEKLLGLKGLSDRLPFEEIDKRLNRK